MITTELVESVTRQCQSLNLATAASVCLYETAFAQRAG